MIEPNKLWQLDGGQRRRKLALTFGALERDIAGIAEKGHEYSFPSMKREAYVGTSLMPPLYGVLSGQMGMWLLPWYLLAILVLMVVMYSGVRRKTA